MELESPAVFDASRMGGEIAPKALEGHSIAAVSPTYAHAEMESIKA